MAIVATTGITASRCTTPIVLVMGYNCGCFVTDIFGGDVRVFVAAIHAAMRADALLDAGDLDGQRVWLRVIEAIRVLANVERPSKGEIH